MPVRCLRFIRSGGAIASYAWTFGDGSTGSGRAPAHAYATGRAYDVTLVVTDADGTSDVTRMSVWANAEPVASFTVECNGPTCRFDGSGSSDPDGTITYYNWMFGDGTYDAYDQSGKQVATHTYPTGTFTATLYVIDNGGGRSGPVSHPVTVVNAPPQALFSVTCTDLTCAADASASTDLDGTIQRYSWNFGESQYAPGYGPVVSYGYSTGATYTITLTVADNVEQTSSATQTVTVVAPPPPTMHVGDLDASSVNLRNSWNAFAEVEVHTENHTGAAAVTVSGVWDDGTAASCTTEWNGRCGFSRYGLSRKTNAVTLRVTGATSASFVYKAADNHEPDGDSSGTAIVVRKQP